MPKHFIILIGGPGLFQSCDPKHDKTWKNYVVPVQVAAVEDLYRRQADETVHWLVFEPPYRSRFTEDSDFSLSEKIEAFFSDRALHQVRKAAADEVIAKGAKSYLDRMRKFAATHGIQYHGLQTPGDFWTELAAFPNGSITRVWYSGHASPAGLFLSLTHDNACVAGTKDIIELAEITDHAALEVKFVKGSTLASEFYGCGTSTFAKRFSDTFKVPAAGSTNAVTFAVIGRSGGDLLERIRTTPTPQGDPQWKVYP